MKKKTIILGLCLASCIGLTGCGSSQDAVVTNLSNQIDFLNNTVNSISRNVSNLPNMQNSSVENYESTKKILNNQKSYKTAITTKNAMIKKAIANNDLKLTKQDKKALIDLTTALSKNTKSLDESRSELVRAATDVSRNYNDKNSTTQQVSAKVNRLSNCMNSQSSYYKNLLNTLNNIESILNIDDDSFDYSTSSENDENENTNDDMQNLIYQYLLNNLNNNNCQNGNCYNNGTNCQNGNCYNGNCNNGNCYNNNCPDGNCYNNNCVDGNCYNNDCLNGNCNNNLVNNTNQRFYNGYNRNGFNPTRNTDTFQQYNRNIDTYRPLPPNDFNYNAQANNNEQIEVNAELDSSDTDIRRNKNVNQVKNSEHRRKKDSSITAEESNLNNTKTNEFSKIKNDTENKTETINNTKPVVKRLVPEEKDNTQTFAGRTHKLSKEMDINSKIRDLINKDKETFNSNNYMELR